MRSTGWIFAGMAVCAALVAPLAAPIGAPFGRAEAHIPIVTTPRIAEPGPTLVRDAAAMQRLRGNSGMTLQWLSWDYRGPVRATMRGRTLWLSGRQQAAGGGAGEVVLNGWVREVGARHFILVGTVTITDTPDIGRRCVREGEMRFQVTQNRRYWRLQRMSECDGLTDYVDVYF